MANREPVIQVKGLYKIYRLGQERVRALNGVDFVINRGEFCSIVGTSGSGKSTLLNMLAGLEKPTTGEIIIAGEHMERKTSLWRSGGSISVLSFRPIIFCPR